MRTFRDLRVVHLLVGPCEFGSFGFPMGSIRSLGITWGSDMNSRRCIMHTMYVAFNLSGALCIVLAGADAFWCRGACCVLRQALRVVRAKPRLTVYRARPGCSSARSKLQKKVKGDP